MYLLCIPGPGAGLVPVNVWWMKNEGKSQDLGILVQFSLCQPQAEVPEGWAGDLTVYSQWQAWPGPQQVPSKLNSRCMADGTDVPL